MLLFEGRKNHFAVTDFRRPRKCLSFSFNPKNRDFITTDEVSNFIFVTEFVTKNVIFVTTATNRPCNSLIINYAYRVQKLPWKVQDFLHREVVPVPSRPQNRPVLRTNTGKWTVRPQYGPHLRTNHRKQVVHRLSKASRTSERPHSWQADSQVFWIRFSWIMV